MAVVGEEIVGPPVEPTRILKIEGEPSSRRERRLELQQFLTTTPCGYGSRPAAFAKASAAWHLHPGEALAKTGRRDERDGHVIAPTASGPAALAMARSAARPASSAFRRRLLP